MSAATPKLVVKDKLELGEDSTIYLRKEEFESSLKELESELKSELPAQVSAIRKQLVEYAHYEGHICLAAGGEDTDLGVEGRALICPCFEGNWYSITMRKEKFDKKTEEDLEAFGKAEASLAKLFASSPSDMKRIGEEREIIDRLQPVSQRIKEQADQSKPSKRKLSQPSDITSGMTSGYQTTRDPSARFPVRQETLYEMLFKNIFFPQGKQRPIPGFEEGLVIISGATGSSKSTVIRGLMHMYIDSYLLSERKRRLHLLTMEDPIEKKYTEDPLEVQKAGVDYTPRQLGSDAKNLKMVLSDALRQTPRVVYLGETRDLRDWPHIMQFAGTGHLVCTTCHASSLIEAMDKVFRACKAETPAQWAQIGRRILAIVHLQPLEVGPSQIVAPALWKRTPQSIAALVSDGLASLLPYADGNEACVGRNWWASELLKTVQTDYLVGKDKTEQDRLDEAAEEFMQKALEIDLEGN